MANEITKFDDLIDSRDVIARIEELEGERDELVSHIDEAREELSSNPAGEEDALRSVIKERETALIDWVSNKAAELAILRKLASEGENSADGWKYGETLIRYFYFKEYAMELAEDCCMGDREVTGKWPYTCIDWDQAAKELAMDYTTVSFDGVDYLIRS